MSTRRRFRSRFLVLGVLGVGTLLAPAWAQDLTSTPQDRKDVSLTIYNNDLSLVREVRTVPVRRGVFHLRYEGVTAGIDATTVHLEGRGGGLQLIEQNYEYDLISHDKLMQKYVGREVGYRQPDGTLGKARLLSANNGYVYELAGKIAFELPGPLVLEAIPEGLSARPTLVWSLEGSKNGSQEVETAYLSSGLSWRADYVLLLDTTEKHGGLTGWVTLTNESGAAFANAQLKLVAGDVNRVRERMFRRLPVERASDAVALNAGVPQFQEEPLFEYHLYTLQRRTDIRDQQTKQILFFDSGKVAVDKEYTFRSLPGYYVQGFKPTPGSEHVDVTLRFKNSKENGLGNPIPAGILRVYKEDQDGAPQFLGENRVTHTPKDEKLEFAVGRAFDVVGEHEQMDFKKLGDRTMEMSYRVTLRNHKDEAVRVRVLENFYGDWEIVQSSSPSTKENATTASFELPVAANAETVLTYKVRIER